MQMIQNTDGCDHHYPKLSNFDGGISATLFTIVSFVPENSKVHF